MEPSFLIKFLPFLTKLLGHQAFVSVKVERSNDTKYTLKIKNNSKYNVEIIKLIANPPVLSKKHSWTCFNDSKFFQNKPLPPGESIDFVFYPNDISNLRDTFVFKAEYVVLLLFNKIKMKKLTEEFSFCPRDYSVKIGAALVQKY